MTFERTNSARFITMAAHGARESEFLGLRLQKFFLLDHTWAGGIATTRLRLSFLACIKILLKCAERTHA